MPNKDNENYSLTLLDDAEFLRQKYIAMTPIDPHNTAYYRNLVSLFMPFSTELQLTQNILCVGGSLPLSLILKVIHENLLKQKCVSSEI